MYRMVFLALVGCGDAAIALDAGIAPPPDVRPDPFAGMFDSPGDFPHDNCTAGAFAAGFSRSEFWPELELRIEATGPLRAFVSVDRADVEASHALASDDLFVRASSWNGSWKLRAIDICGVDADGTVHGSELTCSEAELGMCAPKAFTASPLHRPAGETTSEHLVLLGELHGDWTGATRKVRVFENVAYLAGGADGLRIVSVELAAAPRELGHLQGPIRNLADLELLRGLDGRRYVLAGGEPASQIIDVDDPANPQLVAELAFAASSVTVDGTTGYLIDGTSSRVHAYDLSVPRRPKLISKYEPGGTAVWRDAFAANGILYLTDANGSGIHVVDFRETPGELAHELAPQTTGHAAWLTTVAGRTLALDATTGSGSRLRVLDGTITSPTYLTTLGTFASRELVSLHDIVAIANRVYVANRRDGIRVIDLDDPSKPVLAGYFNSWIEGTGSASNVDGALGIDVDRSRGILYVADATRGLLVLAGDAAIFP
ncbi:MAG: hypothetical protein ABI867_03910 [Kofleriaceae bacterium]